VIRAGTVEIVKAKHLLIGIVVGLLLTAFVLLVGAGCYATDPSPPPCTNIMNCNDPTAPPPQPILFAPKPDAGTDGATTTGDRP
jgi:hypothetical protein